MNEYLQHLIKNIPHLPGVYKMKNVNGDIIYIGKAKDLFKRVGSYFKNIEKHPPKTAKLVENITDIEYIVASSELEALILETNLIKENRPKYNILMKDDKNYAYIKVTTNEDYPRIQIVRKVFKDKAKYFGPKTAASKFYETLKVLRKIFPYRNCNLEIEDLGASDGSDISKKRMVKITKAGIKYPCLDLHIKRCLAPCIGKPSKEDYSQVIQQIINFLEGKYQTLIDQLKVEMQTAAQTKKFEIAAKIRDKILQIESLFENQLVSNPDHSNADIINFYLEEDKAYFNLFQIREGKLIDQQNFTLKRPNEQNSAEEEQTEILSTFLQQFYSENTNFPSEIVIPNQLESEDVLEKWLQDLAGHKVKIITPKAGKKDKLLDLALTNAISFAKQSRTKWEGMAKPDRDDAMEKLAQILGLPKIPRRMECYDISHLSGTNTVASMSVFENGFPKKDAYRHFKINLEIAGSPDDFKSMEEVILRRLKYLKPSIETKGLKITKNKSETYIVKLEKQHLLDFKIISTSKLKTFIAPFPHPENHFDSILKKIIDKFNSKRIYCLIENHQVREYEKLGFQIVNTDLPEYPKTNNQTILTYDKTRNFEDPSFKKVPDLIVIDGGKGQLSHAVKAMEDHQLVIPIISLAKKLEEIFLPNQKFSIQLSGVDPARLMLQHLRDEAHRFAVEYNRKLRTKDYTTSELENIEGVGKATSLALLKHFGSVENLRNQPETEIAKIVGHKTAIKIKSHLN